MRRILLIVTLAVVASLAAGEWLVRSALDARPWKFFGENAAELGLPTMHEPDPGLGWISKAGDYDFPLGYLIRQPERGTLHVTIGDDLMRISEPRKSAPQEGDDARVPVAFIGCSYTFGWAVEDDETFVWGVQERLPELRAMNLGTGGYGSYQSLLRIERYLETQEGERPELVVYGLIGGHAERDVATYTWQHAMSVAGTEPVPVPHVSLEDGELLRHAPEAYPVWPLATRSALVAWAGDRYARWRARDRGAHQTDVHAAAVVEMERVLHEEGIPLLVVLLEATSEDQATYRQAFDAAGVDWVSCVSEHGGDPAYRVPVDNHPNAKLHAIWADCIAPAVRARIAAPDGVRH